MRDVQEEVARNMSANKSICKITSSVSQLLASQTLEHSWAFVLTVKSTTITWLIANYDNRKGMYGITRTTNSTNLTKKNSFGISSFSSFEQLDQICALVDRIFNFILNISRLKVSRWLTVYFLVLIFLECKAGSSKHHVC